jgi:hypothetical protein
MATSAPAGPSNRHASALANAKMRHDLRIFLTAALAAERRNPNRVA